MCFGPLDDEGGTVVEVVTVVVEVVDEMFVELLVLPNNSPAAEAPPVVRKAA